MPAFRHLLVLIAAAGAAAVFTAPASAAVDQCPDPLPNRVVYAMPHCIPTQHFEIWYTTDTGDPAYVNFTEASDFAALYEQVYATEMGYGFPAPMADGDGKIDVDITTLGSGELGLTIPDGAGPGPSSGVIQIDASELAADDLVHVLAHELFHLIQFSSWVPALAQYPADQWLFEGAAEWMGAKVNGFQDTDVEGIGPSDMPLDCYENVPTSPPNMLCYPDSYIENGYSRWPFFQYLAQRFGPTFVNTIFAQGGAGAGIATAALQAALAARGTTLADVYNGWANEQMTGGYGIDALDAVKPTPYMTVSTGALMDYLGTAHVNVDHLSTRYIEFVRGDGDSTSPCFAATLSLSVNIPANTSAQPTFYWDGDGSTAVPLSINGSTATASIPWDTCTWASNEGYLSLPNASTSVDTADFAVTVSMTVDTTQPASPGLAPPPLTVWGTVTSVPSAPPPPALTVYGPELLALSSTDSQIRLVVESNGEGALQASLGSVNLGTSSVRPGANDLRFSLPSGVLNALRRSAAAGNLLTLTPISTDGVTKGTPVTRHVSIAAPKTKVKVKVKVKVKAKAKPKAKTKPKTHK